MPGSGFRFVRPLFDTIFDVEFKPTEPRDAAAAILVNENLTEVLWAQRNPSIPFLGGFHAFPGGKTDREDRAVKVENCDSENSPFIVACAREIFEEVGILLVRNGDKLTKGQRASLHDDLISGRSTFNEILDDWGLYLDAEDFLDTGFWTTPRFSPVRFKTRFFLVVCPKKQTPYQAITEMLSPEFIEPRKALAKWSAAEVLIAPPTLVAMKEIAGFEREETESLDEARIRLARRLRERSNAASGNIDSVEMGPRLICIPLRTKTLPPATHTNCFIVGRREFVVIDAASNDDDEIAKLFAVVDSLIENGGRCREIIVSHLHRDHFGGEASLKNHLYTKFGFGIPISAHQVTAESLGDKVRIDRFIEDDDVFKLADDNGAEFCIRALHTPGHARGHLCFYDEERGFLLSSDNVVGAGTVVISPPEGNMRDYLASLRRMLDLPCLKYLCGSHGAAVFDAKAKINEYIEHRKSREIQVLAALRGGARTELEIAEIVYHDLEPRLMPLAVETVRAHLEKIRDDGTF